MSRIRGKHTSPELKVRKLLTTEGYRYRLHYSKAPGKPDIVFPSRKIAVFVNGCFWHQHKNCKDAAVPKTNVKFWRAKLAGNVKRDEKNRAQLRKEGWRVVTIWECSIKKNPEKAVKPLKKTIDNVES